MRFPLFIIIAALLASLAFAGFYENIEIRVLDGSGRVVPNVAVSVTYEISKSRGSFTTKEFLTNNRGRAYIPITNNEYNDADTNKAYTITAKFGNSSTSKTFVYKQGEYPRTLFIDAYGLLVRVADRDNQPISVPVSVDGQTVISDSGGNAFFILPEGNFEITATYRGQEWKQSVAVRSEMSMNMSLRLYNLTARIVDDRGEPIPAEAYIGAAQQVADREGYVKFDEIPDSKPIISVYSGGMKKSVPLDLSSKNEAIIFFDTHAPSISNIEADWRNRSLQVRAQVADNGTYASGMREGQSTVKLQYIGAGGIEKEVPMYGIGYNFYEGLIPVSGTEESIKYTILATDSDGNRKSSSDTFILPTNRPGPTEGNEPPPAVVAPGAGESNILTFVAAGIAIILAGAVLYYYRDRLPFGGSGGSMAEPPASPPGAKK